MFAILLVMLISTEIVQLFEIRTGRSDENTKIIDNYVSGGNVAGLHQFPFKIALLSTNSESNREMMCGGSLISYWAILTGDRKMLTIKNWDCTKKFKNLRYSDHKVQRFVESKNENSLSSRRQILNFLVLHFLVLYESKICTMWSLYVKLKIRSLKMKCLFFILFFIFCKISCKLSPWIYKNNYCFRCKRFTES
jgi:hypothetical protein